jgi:hypothetical protein
LEFPRLAPDRIHLSRWVAREVAESSRDELIRVPIRDYELSENAAPHGLTVNVGP